MFPGHLLLHFLPLPLLLLTSSPYFYVFVHGLLVYNAYLCLEKMSYPQGQAYQRILSGPNGNLSYQFLVALV